MSVAQVLPSAATSAKDLYEIGEIPPLGHVPASRTQKTLLDTNKYVMIDPIRSTDEAPRWEKLWNELFLR